MKEFSDIAIQYALHVNHVQKARDIFESDCNSFINRIHNYLDNKFENLNHKLVFKTDNAPKISPSGHTRSYWSSVKYKITMKSGKTKSSQFKTVGEFETAIRYDESYKQFAWVTVFYNKDYLGSQLDEKMFDKIREKTEEEQKDSFCNFEKIRFDGLYFQKRIIDEKFSPNFKKSLDSAIDVLISTIADSERLIEALGIRESNKIKKLIEQPESDKMKKAVGI